MSETNSPYDLLKFYLEHEHDLDWVLATVVLKEGSSYRTPGAFMLVNNMGQSFGLVSGGCLESDIIRRAKRVFLDGSADYAEYDMLEENSYAADLGIGCNGKIGILIQKLTPALKEVLSLLHRRMTDGQSSRLLQAYSAVNSNQLKDICLFDISGELVVSSSGSQAYARLSGEQLAPGHTNFQAQDAFYSLSIISAPTSLWVFGGGADAQPLVRMAAQLGWRVTVVDHRPAYARPSQFKEAEQVLRIPPQKLSCTEIELPKMDAAVLMTHNLALDALWLDTIYERGAPAYVGLLGPRDRKQRVGELCQQVDSVWFEEQVRGPIGLKIGGELPESIALSILSECHQALFGELD